MDFNALINAETDEEIEKAAILYDDEIVEEEAPKQKATPTLTDRLCDLIVKKHGEVIYKYEAIPQAKASRWRKQYRKEGFAVDMIEVSTTISATNTVLEFHEKNYVPALVGRIPGTVEMSEQRAAQKRAENHSNMVKKMHRNNKVKETVNDDYKIYNKESGQLVFKGDANECIKFIQNNPDFDITEHVAYLPSKVVEKINQNNRIKEER